MKKIAAKAAPWAAFGLGASLAPTNTLVFPALDAGRVQGPSAPDRPLLAGMAVGLRWAAQAWGGVWQLDTFIGRPLRRPSGLHTATTTAGLSLNASF